VILWLSSCHFRHISVELYIYCAWSLRVFRSQDSRHLKLVGLPSLCASHFYPLYSFLLEAELMPGPQCGRKNYVNEELRWNLWESNPRPFRLVAQYLNQLHHHFSRYMCIYIYLFMTNTNMSYPVLSLRQTVIHNMSTKIIDGKLWKHCTKSYSRIWYRHFICYFLEFVKLIFRVYHTV
jgi:hypothetical protein